MLATVMLQVTWWVTLEEPQSVINAMLTRSVLKVPPARRRRTPDMSGVGCAARLKVRCFVSLLKTMVGIFSGEGPVCSGEPGITDR